jgi:FkbM family methyltransferase
MKQELGWHWPDHERHLLDWMRTAKPPVINGRPAYQGTKQLATIKHCRSFETAVDIGAHIGLWSYNLSHAFKNVVAFEPVLLHRQCFIKNTEGRENIDLRDCALGATEGLVNIVTTHGSSGDSRVGGPGDIPLKTLDSFNLYGVDLIKIDAEGYEENILEGAGETIGKFRPTIVVEQKRDMAARFNLQPQGAVEWLKKRGYKVAQEISGDYIMVPAP